MDVTSYPWLDYDAAPRVDLNNYMLNMCDRMFQRQQ